MGNGMEGSNVETPLLYDESHHYEPEWIQEEQPGRSKVTNFTDLRVWQASMDLAERVYRLTWHFPRQEQYGLSSQLQRSVVSVASNIAEGHARNQSGDFLRFLAIARGSAAEVKTQIMLAQRLDYIDPITGTELLAQIDMILRQLTALRTSIERYNSR